MNRWTTYPLLLAAGMLPLACSGDDESSAPTTVAAPAELPGGEELAILVDRNYLSDGKLFSPMTGDNEPELNAAFCEYLFGTPADVAAVAAIEGDVTLVEGSGFFNLGGSGTGYRCGYAVDDVIQLELTLHSGEPERDFETVAVASPGGRTGIAGYPEGAPEGAPDDATFTEWLETALERLG